MKKIVSTIKMARLSQQNENEAGTATFYFSDCLMHAQHYARRNINKNKHHKTSKT